MAGSSSEIKTDEEYAAYKRERLEEIVSIIRKSEKRMNSRLIVQE